MSQAHFQVTNPRPPLQIYYTNDQQSIRSHKAGDTSQRSNGANYPPQQRARRNNYYMNGNDTYFVSHNREEQNNSNEDHLPEGTCNIAILNDQIANLFGLCLFDSGSLATLLNE